MILLLMNIIIGNLFKIKKGLLIVDFIGVKVSLNTMDVVTYKVIILKVNFNTYFI